MFSSLTSANALTAGWAPPENYREDNNSSLEKVFEESGDQEDMDMTSEGRVNLDDIFGSEQVFPFEPGFS